MLKDPNKDSLSVILKNIYRYDQITNTQTNKSILLILKVN